MNICYKKLIDNLRMAGRFVEKEDGSYETCLLSANDCLEIADLLERLAADRTELRNELCYRCGRYKEAHNGACGGCKWRDG